MKINHNKMKIYYDADLDKRSFEGRTTIARRLKSYLEGQGFEFTENVEEADMMHFHSSGIAKSYLAYKLKKKHNIPMLMVLFPEGTRSVKFLNLLVKFLTFL